MSTTVKSRRGGSGASRSSSLSFEEYQARRHIPILDGVRAISILLVVTYHPAYPEVWPIFHGGTGVSIFFVLSGFLITLLSLREESKYGDVNLRAFYIRRLFRIGPLFMLAFLLYCVLILGLNMEPERRDSFVANIPYYLLFLPEHSIYFDASPLPVPFDGSWSLGIEEKFYFVWPLLGFVVLRFRNRARLVVLTLVAVAATISGWVGGSWGTALAPYGLLAMGCILAILLSTPRSYGAVSRLGQTRWLVPLLLVITTIQLSTKQILPTYPFYVLYGIVITAVMAGLVTSRARWLGVLSTRPMVLLGQLSYGLYLFHNFGLNLAEKLIPQTSFLLSLVSTLLGLGASVLGVWIVHKLIELPCNRLGHRLASRQRPQPSKLPTQSVLSVE
jgi:peptidoglycan/LPS O-acetylase OafA/YrhL